VVNFFTYVAEETREWLAKLGVRSLEELIGRTDLLEILEQTAKQHHLDLTPLLGSDHIPADKPVLRRGPQPAVRQGLLAEKWSTWPRRSTT
jgi:glutamate synthase (NADPH/NADH) large chain